MNDNHALLTGKIKVSPMADVLFYKKIIIGFGK
jgi:hypothetical protein